MHFWTRGGVQHRHLALHPVDIVGPFDSAVLHCAKQIELSRLGSGADSSK
jgi:hypothetical protein